MKTVETQIRAAFERTAREISPADVPDLHLGPVTGHDWPGLPGARRWPGWASPVLAAAAVIAVIAASLTVPRFLLTGGTGHQGAASQAAALASVPATYVALSFANPRLTQNGAAYVRASATGRVITTVPAPAHGTFTAVAGAANDRTWVMAARIQPRRKRGGSVAGSPAGSYLRFYQLSFNPASRAASVTPVRVPAPPTATVTGLALTPDATRMAVSLTLASRSVIDVVSMITGRSRTWSGVTSGFSASRPDVPAVKDLSWAADDRTLAYNNLLNVRLLDTWAPGSSLVLDSSNGMAASSRGLRVTLACLGPHAGWPQADWGNGLLTSDGSLVIASGAYQNGKSVAVTISRKLWQGGKMTYPCSNFAWYKVLAQWRPARYGSLTGAVQRIYWAGTSGQTLIVHAYFGLGGGGVDGVLSGSHFTPLPVKAVLAADPQAPAAKPFIAW